MKKNGLKKVVAICLATVMATTNLPAQQMGTITHIAFAKTTSAKTQAVANAQLNKTSVFVNVGKTVTLTRLDVSKNTSLGELICDSNVKVTGMDESSIDGVNDDIVQ